MTAVAQTLSLSPLDDPQAWISYPAYEEPLSYLDRVRVQTEIDGILGTTRDNKSICKLVWNGDVKYWKQFYDNWDAYGRPLDGLKSRPWVLYKTILDSKGEFVRDAFVPRYLLLTRLEPEQYADMWEKTSKFYCPERRRLVQYKPEMPPEDYYLWFRTIAEHRGDCCQLAAREDRDCHGRYAHPRQCLDELRTIRRGMDERQQPENSPFDSPDVISAKMRETATNNYAEQAMNRFMKQASFLLDEAPTTFVSEKLLEEGATRKAMQAEVRDGMGRAMDAFERKLKQKGAI